MSQAIFSKGQNHGNNAPILDFLIASSIKSVFDCMVACGASINVLVWKLCINVCNGIYVYALAS